MPPLAVNESIYENVEVSVHSNFSNVKLLWKTFLKKNINIFCLFEVEMSEIHHLIKAKTKN